MVVSSPWQPHCDPISTALPFQAVPEAPEEQLWPPPAPWDQVCLCFTFLSKASRDTDVLWDVHVNGPNLWQGLRLWRVPRVQGSSHSRWVGTVQETVAKCFGLCDILPQMWVPTVLWAASGIAFGAKGTDIAVNTRTLECCSPIGCLFSMLRTGHACLCRTCWPSIHIVIDHKDNFSANEMPPCRHVRSLFRALLPDTEMYGCIFQIYISVHCMYSTLK